MRGEGRERVRILAFRVFSLRAFDNTLKINRGAAMKQNITISIDKDLIKKGKSIASKKETSLSRMLSVFLKQAIEEEETYERSKRKALSILNKGFHLGGKITCSREKLHER